MSGLEVVESGSRLGSILAFALLTGSILCSVAITVWMMVDATKRGRPGWLAIPVLVLAFLFGSVFAVGSIALFWIMVRPAHSSDRRRHGTDDRDLPDELPPMKDVHVSPDPQSFLRQLEQHPAGQRRDEIDD